MTDFGIFSFAFYIFFYEHIFFFWKRAAKWKSKIFLSLPLKTSNDPSGSIHAQHTCTLEFEDTHLPEAAYFPCLISTFSMQAGKLRAPPSKWLMTFSLIQHLSSDFIYPLSEGKRGNRKRMKSTMLRPN